MLDWKLQMPNWVLRFSKEVDGGVLDGCRLAALALL